MVKYQRTPYLVVERDTARRKDVYGSIGDAVVLHAQLLRGEEPSSTAIVAMHPIGSPGYLPMPLQYMATAEAQRRVAKYGVDELRVMPVGQIVGRMTRVRPVRDVVFDLMEEFVDATQRLDGLRDEE